MFFTSVLVITFVIVLLAVIGMLAVIIGMRIGSDFFTFGSTKLRLMFFLMLLSMVPPMRVAECFPTGCNAPCDQR